MINVRSSTSLHHDDLPYRTVSGTTLVLKLGLLEAHTAELTAHTAFCN